MSASDGVSESDGLRESDGVSESDGLGGRNPTDGLQLAVDVGNTSIRAARFAGPPWQTPLSHWSWRPEQEPPWQALPSAPLHWWVASVQRTASQRLAELVRRHRPQDGWSPLTSGQFPIAVAVRDKAAVGADRLAAAVAANADRPAGTAVIVVDAGSAITVDLIDESGVFRGGAILPGMAMAARALALDADLLPSVSPAESPPPAVGADTASAIRSGLYWGAWGAIGELIEQYSRLCSKPPAILVTGGGVLWSGLRQDMVLRPCLVLSGIARAAQELAGSTPPDA